MHPGVYRPYKARTRDGELRAHTVRLLNEDESGTPLPALRCLRSQMVVERLSPDRGEPSDGREGDPPPGYQLNPPLPTSVNSTLHEVQYTCAEDSTYSTDSFAESISTHRRPRAPHRRSPLVRHRPRQSSPLRFCTATEEDDDAAVSDGGSADVSVAASSRGSEPVGASQYLSS